jgi:hypothetical protein
MDLAIDDTANLLPVDLNLERIPGELPIPLQHRILIHNLTLKIAVLLGKLVDNLKQLIKVLRSHGSHLPSVTALDLIVNLKLTLADVAICGRQTVAVCPCY